MQDLLDFNETVGKNKPPRSPTGKWSMLPFLPHQAWPILKEGNRQRARSRLLRFSLLLLLGTVLIRFIYLYSLSSGVMQLCHCEKEGESSVGAGAIESLKRSLAEKSAQLLGKDAEISRLRTKASDLEMAFAALTLLRESEKKEGWINPNLEIQDGAKAKEMIEKCGKGVGAIIAPPGVDIWKGYACEATEEEIAQYLRYEPRGVCPDDWLFVQSLLFQKNCFSLPKRRCINKTPKIIQNPLPIPLSLFNSSVLEEDAVRWRSHSCTSFKCLQGRLVGDCRRCFNFEEEWGRWRRTSKANSVVTLEEVIGVTKGRLRLGLDVGGGSGSFAAHMALYNCTIVTTGFNMETIGGRGGGIPYMETISLRGLLPLHLPHKARLPFFDNTLDIVHSINTIKYVPLMEFEELLYEWDRVLRPAGVMWFEKFYTPADEMASYSAVIDLIGYKKVFWNITRKEDLAEWKGPHVYLNCLLEKPERLG